MKKFIFILTVAASFAACSKKNNSTDPGPGPAPASDASKFRVKTMSNPDQANYEYDAQGRQTKSTHPGGWVYEYEYLPGKVNIKNYGAGGVYQGTDTYELNADGFCTSITNTVDPNHDDKFFYNADKTVAKNVYKAGANTWSVDHFYSNGNRDSIRINKNGVWQSTTVYTYYTDKANVLSDVNTGDNFFGKVNKNLDKTAFSRLNDGTIAGQTEISYEFDAQGHVVKRIAKTGNNIKIALYTYY